MAAVDGTLGGLGAELGRVALGRSESGRRWGVVCSGRRSWRREADSLLSVRIASSGAVESQDEIVK